MNNREVAHLWANRSRPSAKGSHFYFEGDTIYSYGAHFPIARLIKHPETGADCVLFTSRDYSRTTSKHKSYVRSACSHLELFFVTDPWASVDSLADLARLAQEDEVRREKERDAARERKNENARRKRIAVKAANEAREAFPHELTAWRAGGPLPRMISRVGYDGQFRAPVALRLIDGGKYIETTKGAKVPACVARKVWPILSAAVAESTGQPQTLLLSVPDFRWGDYTGLTLREGWTGQGAYLVVGCHQIPWAELELMAQSLGLTQSSGKEATA